jgi:hypothetical protein
MNLDQELRAALDREADMPDIPPPDIEGLISRGRVRRRRRNANRVGAVAAAVVLVGGTAYGVTQVSSGNPRTGPDIADQPSVLPDATETPSPQPYVDTDGNPIEPGAYRKYVGQDGSGASISVYLTFDDQGWFSTGHPTVSEYKATTWAGLGVLQPRALAGGTSGCTSDEWRTRSQEPAPTPQALGEQLTRLPRSSVVQPLTTTEAFGYDGVHLRLHIDANCPPRQYYLVAESDGDLGITRARDPGQVVMDIWVVDVDGSPVMVASWHEPEASSDLVDKVTRVRDSIRFVTED